MIPKGEELAADERGQTFSSVGRTAKIAVALVVGLGVLALVSGLLLPIGIDGIVDDDTFTETQNTGETINLTANIDVTLDSTNESASPANATYTLTDVSSGNNVTHVVDNGSEQDFALDGGTVTVGVEDVQASQATSNFTVPQDYGWSGGASSMWFLLDVAIILAVILAALGIAIRGVELG